MSTESADALAVLGALADPTRRMIYEYVSAADAPVSRDQVASEMGMARQTAAYHLDRLADEGLVDVEFVRLSGRTGPGAGRPAKTYRRSQREYEISMPPRRYLLAARILLAAVKSGRVSLKDMQAAAHRVGIDLGGEGLDTALIETGYEPVVEDDEIRFRNCPFHALVDEDRSTTCRLNLALVEGMVEGSGDSRQPCLEPEEGYCCVRVRT
ncbi:MAG: helix-turn-helix transcriptional regulator [Acidimicrobiia bacterium]